MGIACGIDLVEDARIARDMGDEGFLRRVYHPSERSGDAKRLAGIFAVKEAACKALGIPPQWLELEVLHEQSGRPVLRIGKSLLERPLRSCSCSVTHESGMTAAVVVLELE